MLVIKICVLERKKEERKVDLRKFVARVEICGGKKEDVGLDELGEGGKGVVSKIGEFGGDLSSELLGDREGEEDERSKMETKDTLSSCSNSEEQQMQQIQDKAKKSCMIQTTEGKVDSSKALDASLVDTESSRIALKEQDTTSRSGNDTHADDAYIRPIYDEEPMDEEIYKELLDSIKTTRATNIEHTTSLIANNDKFKAQLQEKGFAIAVLKNQLRKLTGNSVNTKFAKSSILGKLALQPRRNQSVVRQPTVFKSERPRFSKQRFASQVDVNNDLSKPVTTHYLPKERESAVAKPHHKISPGSSRYSSNDIVHKHYLEEAKKKTQKSSRNLKPSVMPSATKHGKWWKPTGKIFKIVSLRWVPTGKIFTSSTTKVDSEPTNGSNDDITNKYECEQTLDVSAAMTSDHNSSKLEIHDHINELSSSKLVPKVVPPADKTTTSRQELELLFHHHKTMLRSTHPSDSHVLTMKMEIMLEPAIIQALVEVPHPFLSHTTLSWKPYQGGSVNLPDHRYKIVRGKDVRRKDKDFKILDVLDESKTMPKAKDQDSQSMKEHVQCRLRQRYLELYRQKQSH
ncbi:hypothetical protein Tco_0975539 [Tanacetum coccineum]|uniref:Uncharacterized protein n=1 Tax=Tanacetum coccineum TaxID=301880 RepID=A0ABQ5EEY7_9ASTR